MAYNERETVIVDRGGSGAGMIVGLIVVIALLAIGYLVFFNGNGVAQAGIAKVDLQLPKQLSSRLPTLQKACTEAASATATGNQQSERNFSLSFLRIALAVFDSHGEYRGKRS